jgi:hypothetical protein
MMPHPITLKEARSRILRAFRNNLIDATTVVIGVIAKNQQKNTSSTIGCCPERILGLSGKITMKRKTLRNRGKHQVITGARPGRLCTTLRKLT